MAHVDSLPVLIYDGDCGFCTQVARWGQQRFELEHIAPWQTLDLTNYGLTPEQCNAAVQWVAADGSVSSGGSAVAQVLGEGGRLSRTAGRALRLPILRSLNDFAYHVVAKNRYRFPGSTDACRIDSAPR